MSNKKHWAILGAGNGGQAFAAYLSMRGVDISIYDNFQSTVDALNEQGGVYLEGNYKRLPGQDEDRQFGKILFASTDMGKVVDGAEVIWVIVPSLQVKIKGLGKVGYVANSPYTVKGESMSAGRL